MCLLLIGGLLLEVEDRLSISLEGLRVVVPLEPLLGEKDVSGGIIFGVQSGPRNVQFELSSDL